MKTLSSLGRDSETAEPVAASLCIKPHGLLTPRQAAKVDALKSASPDFTTMRRLAMRFRGILRSKDIQKFGVWLDDAQQSGIYAMQRFARTVRRALSHQPFLLISTYRFAGTGFNKVNGLGIRSRTASAPILARCDNACQGRA